MISIQNLRFSYPRSDFELRIGELNIEQGSKIAIVGPSGSGKTTLLNLISGIEIPASGTIAVNEQDVGVMSESARRDFRIRNIGFVFQQFELVEYLNAKDNILLPYSINASMQLTSKISANATEMAGRMGLQGKLNRHPGQLSQGEQQRVAICRALIANPKLILADEPTGNLDPANKGRILELLFESCQREGQTLIVVTHDMNILAGFDKIVDFEQFRQKAGKVEV